MSKPALYYLTKVVSLLKKHKQCELTNGLNLVVAKEMSKIASKLGRILINDFKQNKTITETSYFTVWLQLRNIINMYHVCESYKRGGPFYCGDKNNPITRFSIRHAHSKTKPYHYTLTTQKDFNPVIYFCDKDGVLMILESFVLTDHAQSAASVLEEILFCHTTLDCSASIQIASYLSILDLLKLLHGKDRGTVLFDTIFGSKECDSHNFNRLRIGTMYTHYSTAWHEFNPLYFITGKEHIVISGNETLSLSHQNDDLRTTPEKFMGYKIGINGVPNYKDKFPCGSYGAWNVIFMGLDQGQIPLFLAARSLGESYILNYEELKYLMTKSFNEFPYPWNKNDTLNAYYDSSSTVGFMSDAYLFDIDKLNLMVTQPDRFLFELQEFCDDAFQKQVLQKKYNVSPLNFYSNYNFSSLWKKHNNKKGKAVDDTCKLALNSTKPDCFDHGARTVDDYELIVRNNRKL